ncbi:Multidrug efflux pump subunit AcrA (membrane-fusion protein) [Micrococcales bacterium KH10]|nr:Multidrug efflux pump subunit AcrA (membrane-fusion protein) [Micrococcales bacterium KH10]
MVAVPDAATTVPTRRKDIGNRRRILLAILMVAALVAVGGTARALAIRGQEQFRVATVALGTVEQSLSATGTVTSAVRADAAFGTAGTIATIDVSVGDEVSAGDLLATLDAEELTEAVNDAETSLADAKQELVDALEAQADGTTIQVDAGSNSTGAGSATPASYVAEVAGAATRSTTVSYVATTSAARSVTPTSTTSDLDTALAAYTKAQQAVTAAQGALLAKYDEIAGERSSMDDDVADVTSTAGACAAFLAVTDPSDEQATSHLEQCQALIQTAQGSLTAVSTLYSELQGLVDTLNDKIAALDEAATALEKAADQSNTGGGNGSSTDTGSAVNDTSSDSGTDADGNTATGPGSGSNGPGSDDSETNGPGASGDGGMPAGDVPSGAGSRSGATPSPNAGGSSAAGGNSSGVTVTAERIVAYRAAVSVAKAELAAAKQAKKLGKLSAPIAGQVAQITMDLDQSVAAGETSAVITILGDGGYQVSATMGLSDVRLLQVGQTFSGTASGTVDEIVGTVANIGMANQSTTSIPSYTVELAVDPVDGVLNEGSMASVDIVVSEESDAVTVPTSAVARNGTQASVTVLEEGEAVTREVEVGAMGTELTQIVSGVEVGDEVVLADLTVPVTNGESSSGSLTDLGGNSGSKRGGVGRPDFSGGMPDGFPGGGFPGAS